MAALPYMGRGGANADIGATLPLGPESQGLAGNTPIDVAQYPQPGWIGALGQWWNDTMGGAWDALAGKAQTAGNSYVAPTIVEQLANAYHITVDQARHMLETAKAEGVAVNPADFGGLIPTNNPATNPAAGRPAPAGSSTLSQLFNPTNPDGSPAPWFNSAGPLPSWTKPFITPDGSAPAWVWIAIAAGGLGCLILFVKLLKAV